MSKTSVFIEMKRKLFLSTSNINERSGGALATLAYYNAMNALFPGYVDLLLPEEFCVGVFSSAISVPHRSKIRAVLSGSLHRYKKFVSDYLKQKGNDYDLCFLNGGIYAGDMMDMVHSYGCKIVVLHHNFEREYQMDNKSFWTLYGRTPLFVIRNERKAYLKADCNLFLTLEDQKLFAKSYGNTNSPFSITGTFEPNNVELSVFDNKREKIIAVTGSMNAIQSMIGITDISKNYYDEINSICPDWDLVIAGRDPGEAIYKLKERNPNHIIVIPNPDDMNDVLCEVSIYLCPTNVGGGLKLRVMDGLKAGLPILVHQVSSRGYDCFFNKPYFKIYRDKESFRNGLEELKKYCEGGYNRNTIQNDYMDYFGFSKGCERVKNALALISKKENGCEIMSL